MKALGTTESESGEVRTLISDMPFVDAVITATGRVLSIDIPSGLFELHEREKFRARKVLQALKALEDEERNRPWTHKTLDTMSMALIGECSSDH